MGEKIDGTLDLLVILDRSGSMQDAVKDHEGGLKSFIEDQKDLAGDVRLTLVQFDTQDPCEIIYDRTPLADVKDIRLIPRGGTPLLDAVGKAVSHLRQKLADAAAVVAMVITDGDENASTEWTKDLVKSLVTEMEAKGWNFLFLGANVDAFATGGGLGIPMASSAGFANTPASVGVMYAHTSSNMMRSRSATMTGASRAQASSLLNYSAEQRTDMSGADPFASGAQAAGTVAPTSTAGSDPDVVTVTTTGGE